MDTISSELLWESWIRVLKMFHSSYIDKKGVEQETKESCVNFWIWTEFKNDPFYYLGI